MEKKVTEIIEIETSQGKLALNIGGTIDRIDSKDDTLRIVDYKTGGSPKTPENIKQLFTPADGRPELHFSDFLVCFYYVPQAVIEGSPFPTLYSSRSVRDIFPCY